VIELIFISLSLFIYEIFFVVEAANLHIFFENQFKVRKYCHYMQYFDVFGV